MLNFNLCSYERRCRALYLNVAGDPNVDVLTVEWCNSRLRELLQLCSMGFSAAAARRAAYMTSNAGIEQASNWLMEHLNDADINEEHPDFVPKMHTTVNGLLSSSLRLLLFSNLCFLVRVFYSSCASVLEIIWLKCRI